MLWGHMAFQVHRFRWVMIPRVLLISIFPLLWVLKRHHGPSQCFYFTWRGFLLDNSSRFPLCLLLQFLKYSSSILALAVHCLKDISEAQTTISKLVFITLYMFYTLCSLYLSFIFSVFLGTIGFLGYAWNISLCFGDDFFLRSPPRWGSECSLHRLCLFPFLFPRRTPSSKPLLVIEGIGVCSSPLLFFVWIFLYLNFKW